MPNTKTLPTKRLIKSLNKPAKKLNEKVRPVQPFKEITDCKAGNIKIKLSKWVLSTVTRAMIELEDITEIPKNNNSHK